MAPRFIQVKTVHGRYDLNFERMVGSGKSCFVYLKDQFAMKSPQNAYGLSGSVVGGFSASNQREMNFSPRGSTPG